MGLTAQRDALNERMTGYGLTPAERRVVWELLRGHSNQEIGATLGVTEHTVKDHLRVVYQKAYVGSRVELVLALLGMRDEEAA